MGIYIGFIYNPRTRSVTSSRDVIIIENTIQVESPIEVEEGTYNKR